MGDAFKLRGGRTRRADHKFYTKDFAGRDLIRGIQHFLSKVLLIHVPLFKTCIFLQTSRRACKPVARFDFCLEREGRVRVVYDV